MLAGLVGCSGDKGDGGPTASTGGPTTSQGPGKEPSVEELGGRRDALVIAELSDADSLLYAVSQSASDSALISNLNMDNYEATFDCSLQYGPALYESWSWDDTHTILKVKLREGVSWSDGKPVTAHDLTLHADDGRPLAALLHAPEGDVRASVVIHGATATPRRYYDRFARWHWNPRPLSLSASAVVLVRSAARSPVGIASSS